jgi:thioredoxin-like negative regulator of GroEL
MPLLRQTETSPPDPDPPLSADDLRSPEEIAERRQRRRRLLVLLVLVALAIGAWFGARPALHALKAWQARRTAATAERLMDEHKWFEAKGKLQDALQLWHQEPAALRAAAHFLGRTGNARESAAFWKQVEEARPLTREEERDYAGVLLAAGDLAPAAAHLRKAWPDARAGTPTDWELGMQLAIRGNRTSEAVDLVRRILASSASTGRQRLTATIALASTNGADAQELAWNEIQKLAEGKSSPESLDALLFLARRAARAFSKGVPAAGPAKDPFPALSELIIQIESHPLAKIQQRLLALELRLNMDPTQRGEILQTAVDRFAGSKDDADLAVLGAWLYGKEEFSRVLEAIPPERANGDRALFFQRLDALGALDRWSEIRDAIQSHAITLDPMIEQMYLARCADKLGETRVRDARWDAALAAAGTNPEKLVQLGEYAGKNGSSDIADKALTAAVQAAPESREAHDVLIRLLETRDDTARLRKELATMLTHWPQDIAVRNDAAYFDALLGENVPTALETARQLVRADPASLPHRITLAMAELRTGNALAALDAFGGIDMTHLTLAARQRAVYAATLWATSYNDEARQQLKALQMELLLPEERVLVQPILDSSAPNW